MLADDVRQCLIRRGGLTVVAAVGNAMRGDDGAGPYVASRLVPDARLAVLDAGTNPENIIDCVAALRPSYLLFIDAADFGGPPGRAAAIGKAAISDYALSTHMFPLRAVWELIERDTEAEICCVGIQPLSCSFGEGLSGCVRLTADEIADAIMAGRKSGRRVNP